MAGLKPEGSTQGVKGRDLLRGQGIGKTVTQWCAQCRWRQGDRCNYRKEVLTEEIKLWDKAAEAIAQVLAAEVIASQEIFQVQSFSATKEPT